MITEDYVSFETAKLLKEKGFDENCAALYDTRNGEFREKQTGYVFNNSQWENFITAPTLQMAMKWLREVHNIHIEIGYNMGYFPVCISTQTNETTPYATGNPFTYEKACEVTIKYCLENLI